MDMSNSVAMLTKRQLSIFQPVTRFILPPAMMTRNPTRVASSTTMASDIRNPVVRHMLQKPRSSPAQSSRSIGNGRQVGESENGSIPDEHVLCRPMLRVIECPLIEVML